MLTLIEKDIRSTIRLLRLLTHGEGHANISVFDAGAGGGFSNGSLTVYLERSGLILENIQAYTPQELYGVIRQALWPFGDSITIEELNEGYKKMKWDR